MNQIWTELIVIGPHPDGQFLADQWGSKDRPRELTIVAMAFWDEGTSVFLLTAVVGHEGRQLTELPDHKILEQRFGLTTKEKRMRAVLCQLDAWTAEYRATLASLPPKTPCVSYRPHPLFPPPADCHQLGVVVKTAEGWQLPEGWENHPDPHTKTSTCPACLEPFREYLKPRYALAT